MKLQTHCRNLSLIFSLAALSACSSGNSSSSGLGLNVAGFWQGTLQSSTSSANFSLNLSQVADDGTNPFSSSKLAGVISITGHTCFTGGVITEGNLAGGTINLTISHGIGTEDELILAGVSSSNTMQGSWVNKSAVVIAPNETTTTSTNAVSAELNNTTEVEESVPNRAASASKAAEECNLSGSFIARR